MVDSDPECENCKSDIEEHLAILDAYSTVMEYICLYAPSNFSHKLCYNCQCFIPKLSAGNLILPEIQQALGPCYDMCYRCYRLYYYESEQLDLIGKRDDILQHYLLDCLSLVALTNYEISVYYRLRRTKDRLRNVPFVCELF